MVEGPSSHSTETIIGAGCYCASQVPHRSAFRKIEARRSDSRSTAGVRHPTVANGFAQDRLNMIGTLSTLLNRPRKQQYFASSVKVEDLALPDEGAREEARCFRPDEVRKIIGLAEEPFRTMFCVLAMTGIRAGELFGLKIDDLDFDRRLVHIRRSTIRGRVQSVKSRASQKPLPLPDALAGDLKEYLRAWRENPERWLF